MEHGVRNSKGWSEVEEEERGFSWWHLGIFLGMWGMFAAITFDIVSRLLDNADQHPGVLAATTAGSVLGPMSGAISRGFRQGCCLAFSRSLLPYGLAAMGVATLVQVLLPDTTVWLRALRFLVWVVGLTVWFGGGIVSLGHAFS